MFNWLNETSLPRLLAGAISAMYMGATIKDAPTPKPPSIRNIKKEVNPVDSAEPIALTVKIRAQYFSTNLRPYLSLKGPENIIAKAATMVNELTEKPSCRSDRLN